MLLNYDYQYVDGGYYFALGNIDNKFFHSILISVPTDDLEIEQGSVYPLGEKLMKKVELYITYLDEE